MTKYFNELNNGTLNIGRKTSELADFFKRITSAKNEMHMRKSISIFKCISDKLKDKSTILFEKILSGVTIVNPSLGFCHFSAQLAMKIIWNLTLFLQVSS